MNRKPTSGRINDNGPGCGGAVVEVALSGDTVFG